ncbi:MAG: hypothetical protein WC979_09510 [Candidatus Pacearchaeota archaeon]|jgi:hypothetical protein
MEDRDRKYRLIDRMIIITVAIVTIWGIVFAALYGAVKLLELIF